MATQVTVRAALGVAAAIAVLVAAPFALAAPALAQAASNPADILAQDERETFTFTFRSTPLLGSDAWTLDAAPSLELPAGGKWRFTLDLDTPAAERFDIEDLRASAFFDVTPRMRIGGALSFSREDRAINRASGGALDDDAPEVKFESAFKF